MKIVVVRRDHDCMTCVKKIKKNEKSLVVWTGDNSAYAVRQHHCIKCARVILKKVLKEVSL